MSNASTEYLEGLANYNLSELGTFLTVALGTFAGCAVAILKASAQSRCTSLFAGFV